MGADCHIRHVVSCTNCHFDTMVGKKVRKAIPASGWVFLMNYEGTEKTGQKAGRPAAGNEAQAIGIRPPPDACNPPTAGRDAAGRFNAGYCRTMDVPQAGHGT